MNSRTSPPETPNVPRARLLAWSVVALVIAIGAALAYVYGPRVLPFLEQAK